MVTRRKFLAVTLGGLIVNPSRSWSFAECSGDGQLCTAGVDPTRFAAIYAAQEMENWCWAASLSMIFAYYGHPVAQERVVETVYGSAVDRPASTYQISAQASRQWIDDWGRPFSARLIAAYDYQYGIYAFDNNTLVAALAAEHPLLYANRSHATVVTAVSYTPANPETLIWNLGMFDPWPGIGMRGLNDASEIVAMNYGGSMNYLALAEISS